MSQSQKSVHWPNHHGRRVEGVGKARPWKVNDPLAVRGVCSPKVRSVEIAGEAGYVPPSSREADGGRKGRWWCWILMKLNMVYSWSGSRYCCMKLQMMNGWSGKCFGMSWWITKLYILIVRNNYIIIIGSYVDTF